MPRCGWGRVTRIRRTSNSRPLSLSRKARGKAPRAVATVRQKRCLRAGPHDLSARTDYPERARSHVPLGGFCWGEFGRESVDPKAGTGAVSVGGEYHPDHDADDAHVADVSEGLAGCLSHGACGAWVLAFCRGLAGRSE